MARLKNITLTIRCSPERGILILNRLYGCGELSQEKWVKKVRELTDVIDLENKKQSKNPQEYKTFYKNISKK